jgi:hypothetical protein
MDAQVLAALAQCGAAGVIGWMWLGERRSAVAREQQLNEAHARVLRQREELGVLVKALRDNTRALSALEAGQRSLAQVLGRLNTPGGRSGAAR